MLAQGIRNRLQSASHQRSAVHIRVGSIAAESHYASGWHPLGGRSQTVPHLGAIPHGQVLSFPAPSSARTASREPRPPSRDPRPAAPPARPGATRAPWGPSRRLQAGTPRCRHQPLRCPAAPLTCAETRPRAAFLRPSSSSSLRGKLHGAAGGRGARIPSE